MKKAIVLLASIAVLALGGMSSTPAAAYDDCSTRTSYDACMMCGIGQWGCDVQHKWCVHHGFKAPGGKKQCTPH